MEYNMNRALDSSELDSVRGGTMSQMIAAMVAAIYNAMDPNAKCTAADHHVVCENPPKGA